MKEEGENAVAASIEWNGKQQVGYVPRNLSPIHNPALACPTSYFVSSPTLAAAIEDEREGEFLLVTERRLAPLVTLARVARPCVGVGLRAVSGAAELEGLTALPVFSLERASTGGIPIPEASCRQVRRILLA